MSPTPLTRSPRRPLGALVALCLVVTGLLAVGLGTPAAALPAAPAGLLASYDFAATSGTTVPDGSGHGYHATIKGTGATVSGDALTLPGGASGSGAGYVELPKGMFDGRNTVSVSMWLKNETGAGNYAAAFFGTTENLPSQYWLLNPANPAGLFKNVVTNGLSAASPWTTESGISPTTASRGVAGPATTSAWAMYTSVVTPTSITGYLNGTKIGTVATTRTVSQFGSNLVAYVGRSSYPDKFYKGGVKDLSVYTSALTDAEVQGLYADGLVTDAEAVAKDKTALDVPGADDVRGNVTLPTSGENGSTIAWSSSDTGVVTTTGEVTRPAHGDDAAAVDLVATLTKGSETATKTFTLTITPLPEEQDLEGYFFPYFKGEGSTHEEELYFSTSQGNDPLDWDQLNNGRTVLESTLGEKGVRDPFILRSPDGDRFYLLSTDLNMYDLYGGTNFGEAQESGSRSLNIWESDDLVHWSAQRQIKVSSDFAGNTWAPEAMWDEATGQYVVYWASNLYPSTDVASRNVATSYNRMMFVTTRDFVSFSAPQPWVDVKRGNGLGMIDASVVKDGDTYYRFIKDEASMTVRQERSTSLSATVSGALPTTSSPASGWQLVKERIGVGQPNPWGGTFTQGEGPTAFQDNTDPDHWYLLIDQPSYHGGQGYLLFETHDLASGDWTSVPTANLPTSPRHGTVLPITAAEQAALLAAYPSDDTADYTISLDESAEGVSIDDHMYGVFFEDINWAADGGLYAELVRNRSFEFLPADSASYTGLTGWSQVSAGGGSGTVATQNDAQRMNERNRTYLQVGLTNSAGGTFGVQNAGYNNGFAIKAGDEYDFSVWARTTAGAGTPLSVFLANTAGAKLSDTLALTASGDGWAQYTGTLTASATTDAGRLSVLAGGTGTLRLDMVSLFPQDTYKGRENGMRKDLAEKIEALDPGFIRFPGGCIVNVGSHQGYDAASGYQRARSYQWKDTVGPVEERATNANFWGYNQSYGLGYYEYFQFAEDIGAKPVPDVPALMNGCGQGLRAGEYDNQALIDRHVQDTLDLIEFANGPVTSEWGALRAEMGHPAPFGLDRLEVGNEENYPVQFMANFVQFRDAIKAVYPDITVISNSGPDDEGTSFDTHWAQNKANDVDMVDEHYYNSPTWFLQNNARYDSYDREGPDVWIGEYASLSNRLDSALSEAAYMTGLERNADVVKMASYAPLLANVDHVQWTPDMIWFDNDETWGSANYEVQKLMMNNVGDRVVPTQATGDVLAPSPITGSVGLSSWSTSVRYDDVKVTSPDGSTLFSDDFNDGNADGWDHLVSAGSWSASTGSFVQSSTSATNTMMAGPALTATDYDLSVKATKLSGAEGFLVGFGVKDSANYYWWNLGGFNNTRSLVEKATDGAKQTVASTSNTSVTTNQTYDVKIEVRGTTVKLYLDGVLRGSFNDDKATEPFAQVLTKDDATGDLILKVVNSQDVPAQTQVDLGTTEVGDTAELTVIKGNPSAVNSRTSRPVKPVTSTIDGIASSFTRSFPPYSVSVLRIPAGPPSDTTAPELTVTTSPAAPDGTNGWYTSAVTVSASATDDSGAAPTIQYSVDGGTGWSTYGAALVLQDGQHSVTFRASDEAGNTSEDEVVTVQVDAAKPTATASTDLADREVTVSGSDALSGVAAVEYQVDGASTWTTVAGDQAVVPVGTAAATVTYRAVDVAGNTGNADTVSVPAAEAPKATVELTSSDPASAEGWYRQRVVVRITAPSGHTAQYRVDSGAWKTARAAFALAANGAHTVDHRLVRGSTEVAGSTGTATVKIDKVAPTAKATRAPSTSVGTTRNPVTLSFTATDNHSGVASVEYRLDRGAWTTVAAGVPVLVDQVGAHVVSYRASDAAGNVSATRTTTVKITAAVATSLEVSPGKVARGGPLTARLAGFDRYDTVTLSLGAITLGTVLTNVNGAASLTVTVPPDAPVGVGTIVATGSGGDPTASKAVTVKP